MLAPDRAQGYLAKGRADGLDEALCIGFPASFLALGSRHVVSAEKLLQGHFCGFFVLLLPGFSLALLFRLLTLFGQALRAFSRANALAQPRKHLVGFFRAPAFGRPSDALFLARTVDIVADGKVSVGLPVPGAPRGMLVIAHIWVCAADPLDGHFSPLMLPYLCVAGGSCGKLITTQILVFSTHGKSGDSAYRVQGLVPVREWEFESPLRHQKKIKRLAKSSDLANLFFFFLPFALSPSSPPTRHSLGPCASNQERP